MPWGVAPGPSALLPDVTIFRTGGVLCTIHKFLEYLHGSDVLDTTRSTDETARSASPFNSSTMAKPQNRHTEMSLGNIFKAAERQWQYGMDFVG